MPNEIRRLQFFTLTFKKNSQKIKKKFYKKTNISLIYSAWKFIQKEF